jgi:hypothetical protein
MKPLSKIKINWSPDFAYAIGLITTDGNLSKDRRHIHFTSKDLELVLLFKKCLSLSNKIGHKSRGGSRDKKYFVVQFGDVIFYRFLESLGLKTAKSKTLEALNIPSKYFVDFLRGCIDGDGSVGAFKHPESRQPQLRVKLYSASYFFLVWIKKQVNENFKATGGWIQSQPKSSVHHLVFAKSDSVVILKSIYYPGVVSFLLRKYNIIKPFLGEWRNWHTRTA